MAGMRDRLIHNYFGVDYELVWDVVQHRVPEVRRQLETILKAEQAACYVGASLRERSRPSIPE